MGRALQEEEEEERSLINRSYEAHFRGALKRRRRQNPKPEISERLF